MTSFSIEFKIENIVPSAKKIIHKTIIIGLPEYSGTVTAIQRDLFFSREIIESGDFMKMIDGLIDVS